MDRTIREIVEELLFSGKRLGIQDYGSIFILITIHRERVGPRTFGRAKTRRITPTWDLLLNKIQLGLQGLFLSETATIWRPMKYEPTQKKKKKEKKKRKKTKKKKKKKEEKQKKKKKKSNQEKKKENRKFKKKLRNSQPG